jgi:dTDP-4-dehydrorhamnose reductase
MSASRYVPRMTWVVTGAGGQLGSAIVDALVRAGERVLGLGSPSGPLPRGAASLRVDLDDVVAVTDAIQQGLAGARCRYVVHTAALSSVAGCLADPALARRMNSVATGDLARLAMRLGAHFVYTSTDMVFDGEGAPYAESAEPSPLSAYGRSKLEGEAAARNDPTASVVRLPLLYGLPSVDRKTTFRDQVAAIRRGEPLTLFEDEYRTPLSLRDAATAVIRITESSHSGVLHVAGPERLSRLDMGRKLAARLGVLNAELRAASRLDTAAPEPRARDLSLDGSEYERRFGPAGRPMDEVLASADLDE